MTSPELEPWVEALRADLPDADERERLRNKLIGAGVVVAGTLAASRAAAASSAAASAGSASAPLGLSAKLLSAAWSAKVGLLGVAAVGIGLAALPLVVMTRGPTVENAAPPYASARPVHVPTATPPRPLVVQQSSAPMSRATHTESQQPPMPDPQRRPPSALTPRPNVSRLGEESRLISQALIALHHSDRDAARAALQAHRRRFPNGTLAVERDRLVQRADGLVPRTNPHGQGDLDE